MGAYISTRNTKSQEAIFPPEMVYDISDLVKCCMKKAEPLEVPEIFLGDWLSFFGVGPSEAARIAGCTQGYISNISYGRRPNVNTLYLLRISNKLGINVNDFYRPLPSKSQLAALQELSPKARAAILEREHRVAETVPANKRRRQLNRR